LQLVDEADGFVERRVLLEAVDWIDFEAFLVQEGVEDFVCISSIVSARDSGNQLLLY
jgi:hypothetical protein